MYNILTLNKIAPKGLEYFTDNYSCLEQIKDPDAILVRSAVLHERIFSKKTVAIARAGAGVNNIPLERCTEEGIVVFNTPGANSNAVKELVIAGLLMASRRIFAGIEFAQSLFGSNGNVAKLIEKKKSCFAGPELMHKKLGVIGLGAIGKAVADSAISLGMEVWGYDPYISVDSAWQLSAKIHHAKTLDEIYDKCDYITLHLPLLKATENMINAEVIGKMKDGVRLLNFARGGLVNSKDVRKAVKSSKIACYVTDFPSDELLGVENIVTIPHLGASTPESEDNCAIMAVKELRDYIENGNITNSVNMPNVSCTYELGHTRICMIHKNIKKVLSTATAILSENNINIENMYSKAKNDIAYAILDVSSDVSTSLIEQISNMENVIKVRVIKHS